MTAQIHEWCDRLDDPERVMPCPCRAYLDNWGKDGLSPSSKRSQSKTLRDAIVRARRTDDIAARAGKAAA